VHSDHPLSEETAAWFDQMAPLDRYASMLAIQLVVTYLLNDPG